MKYAILCMFTCCCTSVWAESKYTAMAERCQAGVHIACDQLRANCDLGAAISCFHLSYSLGLRGDDVEGLEYLRKACDGGLKEACRNIPIIIEYIEAKYENKTL